MTTSSTKSKSQEDYAAGSWQLRFLAHQDEREQVWDSYEGVFRDSKKGDPLDAFPDEPKEETEPTEEPKTAEPKAPEPAPKAKFTDVMEAFTVTTVTNTDEVDDELANLTVEERAAHVMARLEVGPDGSILERDAAHLVHMMG